MDHPEVTLRLGNSTWTVLDKLKAKHPSGQPASKEALHSPSIATSSFHPVV